MKTRFYQDDYIWEENTKFVFINIIAIITIVRTIIMTIIITIITIIL